MARLMIFGVLAAVVCVFVPTIAEKQIKLEDIEKDNLKAAQEAKLEKEYQQQYQQYQYQQSLPQHAQQVYNQQSAISSTYPTSYSQYFVPQQYVPQPQLYSGYTPLPGNSLGTGYSSASSFIPFQAYYTSQLPQAIPQLQNGQHIASTSQPQPIIMALASNSLPGLQQQPYYQVLPKTLQALGNVQYVGSEANQPTQYYYQSQVTHQQAVSPAVAAPAHSGEDLIYSEPQQYVPAFQPLPSNKLGATYQQQYVAAAPFYSTSDSSYSGSYPSQGTSYPSSSVYPNRETPTFVSLKAPQHLVASPGQHRQYLEAQSQSQTTTVSPFKYLNSPQYLAQNYNTIQSSHLIPKNSHSSGIKSTASPPIKVPGNAGYITPSSSSSSSSSSNGAISYQTYRGIAG